MTAIILLHRWLGIAFCLLFAMWFASGIVMHFVPFPSMGDDDRFDHLALLRPDVPAIGPAEAVRASGVSTARRVRLIRRADGLVYVVTGASRSQAIRAGDGSDAAITSDHDANAVASDDARRHAFAVEPTDVSRIESDQWTVSGAFDRHRPLFRAGMNDAAGTQVYISSTTGEIVLDTTRRERAWNMVGSVPHWFYLLALRSHPPLWTAVVQTLALTAAVVVALGAATGLARLKRSPRGATTPYRSWHALHHIMGLLLALVLFSWTVSGWLSMEDGRLFSTGELTSAEAAVIAAPPDWSKFDAASWPPISADAREVEWFAFGGTFYRRDRAAADRQILLKQGEPQSAEVSTLLAFQAIADQIGRIAKGCAPPLPVAVNDDYPASSATPGVTVVRVRCGDVWFDVDRASGAVLQRLDRSRRAWRWLYRGLHALDVPIVMAYPSLRTILIVSLCSLGFVFSMTAVVIGWRRLRTLASSSG